MASTTTHSTEGSSNDAFSTVAVASNSSMTTNQFCIVEKLTSSVYGVHNPPRDWADIAFLIPHEAIRHELTAMCRSIDQLVLGSETAALNTTDNGTQKTVCEGWQAVYFCEWFTGPFTDLVSEHHDNEEFIYFPWLKTRADLTQWNAAKLSHGHEDLVESMIRAGDLCYRIIAKKGEKCAIELSELKIQLRELEEVTNEHLADEERDIPSLLRANFTQKEEEETVQNIIKRNGMEGMRIMVPSILFAMQQWASPAFYEEFWLKIPGPMRRFVANYCIPDYENCVAAKRDAPFWQPTGNNRHSKRPPLKRTKCCRIPFCFPCIV